MQTEAEYYVRRISIHYCLHELVDLFFPSLDGENEVGEIVFVEEDFENGVTGAVSETDDGHYIPFVVILDRLQTEICQSSGTALPVLPMT